MLFFGADSQARSQLASRMVRAAKRRGHQVWREDVRELSRKFRRLVRVRRVEDWETELSKSQFLFLENIEKIAGCRHTQNFLLGIWTGLILAHSQIVLTSAGTPFHFQEITPRLRSHIESGFFVDMGRSLQPVSLNALVHAVAEKFAVSIPELTNSNSHRSSGARAALISLALESGLSKEEILSLIGDRTRSSLHYAQRQSEKRFQEDPNYRAIYESLRIASNVEWS